jgi:hypothetical protein
MTIWPEDEGTDNDGVDWVAYKIKTARPGSLTPEEQARRDSEESVKVPPRRSTRSTEV